MAEGRKTTKNTTDLKVNYLVGMFIKNERGRAVYYDVFSKTGYILANNEDRYKQFSMRFVMGAIGFILMLMFNMPIWLCILAGVAVYGFLEFRFRRFLKNLVRIENFKCNEKMKSESSIKTLDTNKIILKMVLLLALAVLIIINAYNENYTGWMLTLNYVISALTFIFALYHAKELISRKRRKGSVEPFFLQKKCASIRCAIFVLAN